MLSLIINKLFSKKEKKTLIGEVLDNPERFELNAYIEGEEVVIRVKRRVE